MSTDKLEKIINDPHGYGRLSQMDIMEMIENIPSELFDIPINALQISTIAETSRHLDLPTCIPSRCNHLPDYTGVGELMSVDRQTLDLYTTQLGIRSPTERLIRGWSSPLATIGTLLFIFKLLERHDILQVLRGYITRDVEDWRQQEERRERDQAARAVQIPDVSTTGCEYQKFLDFDDTRMLTRDVFTSPGRDKGPRMYHAWLSYCSDCEADVEAMKIIRTRLEKENLEVACGSYDLIAGHISVEAYTQAIISRCARVVVLISSAFKSSKECKYQMTKAFSMDPTSLQRKVIPVYLENVEPPVLISQLSSCQYFRKNLDKETFFWPRLIASLMMD